MLTEDLQLKILNLVSDQSDEFLSVWDKSQAEDSNFLCDVFLSVYISYVCLSLVSLSTISHRREIHDDSKQKLQDFLYSSFALSIQRELDSQLFETSFADSQHIDECFSDNALTENQKERIRKCTKIILDMQLAPDECYLKRLIAKLNAHWFDSSTLVSLDIAEFSIAYPLESIDSTKHFKIAKRGPTKLATAHILITICQAIIEDEFHLNKIYVSKGEIDNTDYDQLDILLSRMGTDYIDYNLDKDPMF